jgi:prevent-host-death family protein
MRSVGVRELRQHASKYLRLVEEGETIEVTDRGRPVARLVPVPTPEGESILDRLRREGRLLPPRRAWLDVEPLPAQRGLPLPSEVLEQMRADER